MTTPSRGATGACDATRAVLASDMDHGVAELSDEVRLHLSGCARCTRALSAYRMAVPAYVEATEEAPLPAPDFSVLRSELGLDRSLPAALRARLARGWSWSIPLAAAAAALLVVLMGPEREAVAPPPGPVASSSSEVSGDRSPGGLVVASIEGDARQEGSGSAEALALRERIGAGSVIVTDGGAEVRLDDPGIADMVVSARSRIEVLRWSPADARVLLDRGRVAVHVRPRAAGQRFEVRTPEAVVVVVGTEFVVERGSPGEAGPGTTRVEVQHGEVQVLDAAGAEVARLGAGSSLLLGAGRVEGSEVEGQASGACEAGFAFAEQRSDPHASRGHAPVRPSPPEAVWASENRPEAPPAVTRAVIPEVPGAGPSPPEARSEPTPGVEARSDSPPASPAPSPHQVFVRARSLLASGADGEAIELLEAATGGPGPAQPRLLALLGDAYRIAGRYQVARGAYERALERGARRAPPTVLVDLAELLEGSLGDAAGAAGAWARYLEAFPRGSEAPRATLALARLRSTAGQTTVAQVLWTAVVDRFPRSREASRAFVKLSKTELAEGDPQSAAAFFAAYLDHANPSVAETAFVGLMRARHDQGRHQQVLELVKRYRLRFPNGPRRAEVERLESASE